jgi:hypothetical protein
MLLNIPKSFSLFLQERGSSLGEWPGGEREGTKRTVTEGDLEGGL